MELLSPILGLPTSTMLPDLFTELIDPGVVGDFVGVMDPGGGELRAVGEPNCVETVMGVPLAAGAAFPLGIAIGD